jgi:hypothetical protein
MRRRINTRFACRQLLLTSTLIAWQVLADFASCFALGLLLQQAAVVEQTGTGTPPPTALRWGYAITACGFVFLFGPASVAASFARAAAPRQLTPEEEDFRVYHNTIGTLSRVVAAAAGAAMLAGLLYIVAGAALLLGGEDVYCMRYTGTPQAKHEATCGAANGGLLTCAAGGCVCATACQATQREALLAFKATGNTTALAAWRAGGHPCVGGGWPDVTCDANALVTRLDLHGVRLGGSVAPLAALGALSYLNLKGTGVTGWPLAIADGCCTFADAAHPHCAVQPWSLSGARC